MKKSIHTFFTTARIAGIILLVIAALAGLSGRSWMFIALLGIILLLAQRKYAHEQIALFNESVTSGKKIAVTALYDSIFWLLFFGSSYFYIWRLSVTTEMLQAGSDFTKQAMFNTQMAIQNANAVQHLVFFFIIGIALLFIFNLISYTFFRMLSFTTVSSQKISKSFFLKFLGLNAIWWVLWSIPLLFFAVTIVKNPSLKYALFGVFFIPCAYFTPIVHTLFTQTKRIGFSLGHGIGTGIAKIHHFIFPYTLVLVLYLILFQIFRVSQILPQTLTFTISMLFVVLFLAWLRVYLFSVVSKIPKE